MLAMTYQTLCSMVPAEMPGECEPLQRFPDHRARGSVIARIALNHQYVTVKRVE
jgi:hypothetical protein